MFVGGNPNLQNKKSFKECVLYGTINNKHVQGLYSTLEGISDHKVEMEDLHKTIFNMKPSHNYLRLALIRKIPPKDCPNKPVTPAGMSIIEYQGTPDTQVSDKVTTRTVVRAYARAHTQTLPRFLTDLGFKPDYEMVLRGRRYRTKQIETFIYKVQKIPKSIDPSSAVDISQYYLVECTVPCHNLSDPVVSEFLSFAENLRPVIKLEKFDATKLNKLRDLLLIDSDHKKLSDLLQRPASNLINPDTKKRLTHPVSTHLMLLPDTRRKLLDELEYQHANAATPQNMVKEDPANFEAYANEIFSRHEDKVRLEALAQKKHPRWLHEAELQEAKESSAVRMAELKLAGKLAKYPYQEVRGVIKLQMEAIKQCEQQTGQKVL